MDTEKEHRIRQQLQQCIADGDNFASGNLAVALEAYADARKLLETLEDSAGVAELLMHKVAPLYIRHDEFGSSRSVCEEVLFLFKQLNHQSGEARAHKGIAFTYQQQDDYSYALEHYQSSLQLFRGLEDHKQCAQILNNIGNIYKALGDYHRALKLFQESLALKMILKDVSGAARTKHNLGNTYKTIGDHDLALTCFSEAHEAFKEMAERETNPTLKMRYEAWSADSLHGIGNIYLEQEQFGEATQAYLDSLKVHQRIGLYKQIFAGYRDLGTTFLAQGNPASSLRYFKEAEKIAEQYQTENHLAQIYTSFAQYYLQLDEQENALDYYLKAIAVLEGMRAKLVVKRHVTDYLQSIQHIYIAAIQTSLNLDRVEDVFNILEKMYARTLLDFLNSSDLRFTHLLTKEEADRESDYIQQIESITNTLLTNIWKDEHELEQLVVERKTLWQQYEEFEEQIYISHPELRDKRGRNTLLDLEAAKALINRFEAAVYYLLTSDSVICLVLTKRHMQVVQTSIDNNTVQQQVSSLITSGVRWNQQLAGDLYDLLIRPVKDYLKGIRRLCIVPHSVLNLLPFQALVDLESDRYLIQDFEIYYTPSLSTLRSMRSRGTLERDSLLAFGDPVFPETPQNSHHRFGELNLEPLPETLKEVQFLEAIYEPKIQECTGIEANKANFMRYAPEYGILHFATHAISDMEYPQFSAIALTRGKDDNGFIEAREIMQLELNADLVVLSACQTALGKVLPADGTQGLTRAFMTSGVPSVVSTLWKVNDRAAHQLMVVFHSGIRNNESKVAALRNAQLRFIESPEFNSPYFWAPYILTGDAE